MSHLRNLLFMINKKDYINKWKYKTHRNLGSKYERKQRGLKSWKLVNLILRKNFYFPYFSLPSFLLRHILQVPTWHEHCSTPRKNTWDGAWYFVFYKHLKMSLCTRMAWRMHMACTFECVCIYMWPLNVCRSHVDTGSLPPPFSIFVLNKRIFHWIWSSYIPAHLDNQLDSWVPGLQSANKPPELSQETWVSKHQVSGLLQERYLLH